MPRTRPTPRSRGAAAGKPASSPEAAGARDRRGAPDGERQGSENIVAKGVRVHNLKNIDVTLPRRRLVVITGPSGSGKSSLAFDTLYAEGQRRYIESLSSYAHQYLDQLPRPDVDRIEGLSPSLAIDQKGLGGSPRSTVGTVTEIANFLRLLYARCGVVVCPECNLAAAGRALSEIEDEIAAMPAGARFYLLAPVIRGRKGAHRKLLADLLQQGFVRVVVDGVLRELEDEIDLKPGSRHDIAVVVDGMTSRPGIRPRLSAALERSVTLSKGSVIVWRDGEQTTYSRESACPGCGRSFPELDPRLFSFNSPYGSCPECQGLGTHRTIEPERLVPDPTLSVAAGAVAFLRGKETSWLYTQIEALAAALEFSLEAPFGELPPAARDVLLSGLTPAVDRKLRRHASYHAFLQGWPGLIPELMRRHRETKSEKIRQTIETLMSEKACAACDGYRLRPEALSVRIADRNIGEVSRLPLVELLAWFARLSFPSTRQKTIARPILDQIVHRLRFLVEVGVGYLCLARTARSLSGGEGQRVRLGTQVGSRLTGVLYILDEPSVGLHHRDIHRLIATLRALRDRGNSVVVVEHDRDLMRAADHILDLGPGAGEHGGRIVAQGDWRDLAATPGSLTGDYLAGRVGGGGPEPICGGREAPDWLEMRGLRGRNLKGIDLRIPRERLTVVTGVSGSGKSTALHDTFYRALAARLHQARTPPQPYDSLSGVDDLQGVALVDQSPIGRTPRSIPATYTGLFGHIRNLFAMTTLAKVRGYPAGRFSFNTAGGRCDECEGAGMRRLTMDFLPDVEVVCESCGGGRFNRETLEVHFKGRNMAQVLEMTVEEAREYLGNIPACRKILDVMHGVGLGYLRLGQAGSTLSGGEAQRIKLVRELARGGRQRMLYILDEPTTGLHFCDVDRLLAVLKQLIDHGHTVVVIEHHPDVIRRADHVIDLGPEGGEEGGRVVVQGNLEAVIAAELSYTGAMLRQLFGMAAGEG
jgi:excinuclease ABC subunit A